MRVLVDTPIWSFVLRRRRADLNPGERRILAEWEDLVQENQAVLLGVVRQEALSGISHQQQYQRLMHALRDFADEPVITDDYEQAADCFNKCRSHGIQGSLADYLICAVAIRLDLPIFTADEDFKGYALHLPIRLYQIRVDDP